MPGRTRQVPLFSANTLPDTKDWGQQPGLTLEPLYACDDRRTIKTPLHRSRAPEKFVSKCYRMLCCKASGRLTVNCTADPALRPHVQ